MPAAGRATHPILTAVLLTPVSLVLPLTPCPRARVQMGGLEVVKTVVQDSPHKLFIGGLPCDWSEEQVGRVGCGGMDGWMLQLCCQAGEAAAKCFALLLQVLLRLLAAPGRPLQQSGRGANRCAHRSTCTGLVYRLYCLPVPPVLPAGQGDADAVRAAQGL
jgi:hypothetical protein